MVANLFADHDDAWNEWVDPKKRPRVPACRQPQRWRPGSLVEIMVDGSEMAAIKSQASFSTRGVPRCTICPTCKSLTRGHGLV